MEKILFVYNTMSGSGTIRTKVDMINERCNEAGKILTSFRISKTNHIDLSEVMNSDIFDGIIVAGGDGTINSVVNCMFNAGLNIPIGVLPCGTSNDFVASIGLSGNISKCVDNIIKGKQKYVDIGILDRKTYFVGTCAGGIFVNVSYKTSNDFKRALGPTAYYIKALAEIGTFKPFNLSLELEDSEIIEKVETLLFFITNGSHAGGFTQLIQNADLNDGLMDIVIIKNCQNVELVNLLIKAVTNNLLDDKNVIHIRAKKCKVDSDKPLVLSVDGEKGDELPVSFEVISNKLKIYVP